MSEAWRSDEERRERVLEFLVTNTPEEGLPLAVSGLHEPPGRVRSMAYVAVCVYVFRGQRLAPQTVELLRKTVESVATYSERRWALMALERIEPDWFPDWVRQFTENDSDITVRVLALRYLIDRGEVQLIPNLVRELRWQDEDETSLPWVVWRFRDRVALSPQELALAKSAAEAEVNLHRKLHDEWIRGEPRGWHRYPSWRALALLQWLGAGIAMETADIRRVEEFVDSRRRLHTGDRLKAVRALAALDHPGVDEALRRLSRSRFAGVRREALRALQARSHGATPASTRSLTPRLLSAHVEPEASP
jgi:hypothetical protein